MRLEDIINGYILLNTKPGVTKKVYFKDKLNMKELTPYWQHVVGIVHVKDGDYRLLLDKEGQAKWNKDYDDMEKWIGKYGCD